MIDLKPFCGRNDPREYLNAPWIENGMTYATNGHMGIRINQPYPGAPPADPYMAGRIEGELQKALAATIPLQITFPAELAKNCDRCTGWRFVVKESCEECEGGSFSNGSHTYDCKECDGMGEINIPAVRKDPGAVECDACSGSGKVSRYIYLMANGVTHGYQEKYLRLIAALPNVRFFVTDDNTRCARFDFDGGSGVLMPVRI